MNTLNIEKLLAEKYKYKPLSTELSEKYRQFFFENVPNWLSVDGGEVTLYTSKGTVICNRYDRVVIGDYGAFVEFSEPNSFIVQPGQEYRLNDERYSKNVKYVWLTIADGSGIKIYHQKKTVAYADYMAGKYYVSVHEVSPSNESVVL